MIGIIAEEIEKEAVEEFFELFKTPWEFYRFGSSYEVVLLTRDVTAEFDSRLIIIYGAGKKMLDSKYGIALGHQKRNVKLEWNGVEFPVYGGTSSFDMTVEPLIKVQGTSEAAGIKIDGTQGRVLRLGYNLFQEITILLSSGQPVEFAHIPTLEIHISMLRDFILASGIPLVEIPPVPWKYDFIACLTHDVDFVRLRNHRLDPTMFGFVYRAFFGSLTNYIKRNISLNELLKNWKAVLLLPFVYLRFVDDFWVQFERYMEIEKGLGSTFFFIPFKKRAGKLGSRQAPKKRATKYYLLGLKKDIQTLVSRGYEIGLHGIDAWQDAKKAREEVDQIYSIVGESDIGVRMHWLYFNRQSPAILEEAGLFYDSTLGYNDAVGYWGGTMQVFRPLGSKKLMELPLNIQDTAMFYPDRMGLRKEEAFNLCKELIKNNITFGGVLVINWHQRSIAPERLWGEFYMDLLNHIKSHKVYFGTAKEVVLWFQQRREARFDQVDFTKKGVNVKVSGKRSRSGPGLSLRLYKPRSESSFDFNSSLVPREFVQVRIKYNFETEVSL